MKDVPLFEIGEIARTTYILAYADKGDDFAFREGKVVKVIPDGNYFSYTVNFGKPVKSGSGEVSGPFVRIPETFLMRKVPTQEIPYEEFLLKVDTYSVALTQDMNNEQRHLILHGLETLLNRATAIKNKE